MVETICPTTGDECAVLVRITELRDRIRTPEQFLLMSTLETNVERILKDGNCVGAKDEGGGMISCSNTNYLEVAQEMTRAATVLETI